MIIHWFRRDLRLSDNTALAAAARAAGGAVLPVFILDDAVLFGRYAGGARTAFLLASLRALDAELRARGSRLVVRRGEPLRELAALARESGAEGVYWNRDYTPYAVRRDSAAKAALRGAGLRAESFKDAVIFELLEVATADGRPYTVYTPYARRWRQLLAERGLAAAPAPDLAPLGEWPAGLPIPALGELGMALDGVALPPAGEAEAHRRLGAFADLRGIGAPADPERPGALADPERPGALADLRRELGMAGYARARDLPGVEGTSRLSPHLRLGSLSPRQCVAAALRLREDELARAGAEAWLGELIWRDFYVQVLCHHPHVLRGAFRRKLDALAWENDEGLFEAWRAGRTGYPLVDAAMRQLRQEGWMHNRARMVVASFLTKDLLIDWRWGERHFMRLLVDGDPAANNGGWQWAAGTGTDAQPYFRIFNPASQGQKFDPQGAYVRHYLPELANVPDKHIHAPHLMAPAEQLRADVQIGRDYPAPVVDHKLQRGRALELYGRADS